jgi:hypothetical protein
MPKVPLNTPAPDFELTVLPKAHGVVVPGFCKIYNRKYGHSGGWSRKFQCVCQILGRK